MDDRAGNEQQTQQLRRGHAGRHAVLRGRQRRDHVHVERRTVERQTERLGANRHHAVPQVKRNDANVGRSAVVGSIGVFRTLSWRRGGEYRIRTYPEATN